MKDAKYFQAQTPRDLAKLLIEKIPLVSGDVVWEPFRGEGAFYQQLPSFVHKDWSEVEDGRNFVDYKKRVDWIVSFPPYKDITNMPTLKPNESVFFQIIEHFVIRKLARKGIVLLANKECYMSITPKRMDWLHANGWRIQKQVLCNLKNWRGRFMFIFLIHDDADVNPASLLPPFDHIIGHYPLPIKS